jgi:hypothetical protein
MAPARVGDLLPGDLVTSGTESAVFVGSCRHPLWPLLRLVIWRLGDGGWSHDALGMVQEVGEVSPATEAERTERLRAALIGGG